MSNRSGNMQIYYPTMAVLKLNVIDERYADFSMNELAGLGRNSPRTENKPIMTAFVVECGTEGQ